MSMHPKAVGVLRNPWNFDESVLEWARKEIEGMSDSICPNNYEECKTGCCYPSLCGKKEVKK